MYASPRHPTVSESRIKRITQITRITPHIPTTASSFPLRSVFRIRRPITRRDRPLCLALYIINQRSVRNPCPTPPCLNRGLNGLRGLRGLPHTALPPQTYPPGPLSYKERGERMAFLKGCIQACFDGFGRMDHAMKSKNRSPFPLPRRKGARG